VTPPTDDAARPHRARRGEGVRLRHELMDAAEALLIAHGHPDRVSMRAVAKRVGVTPAAIYLHFEDKEELFFDTCQRRFLELAELAIEALEGTEGDARSRLRALGHAYIRWGLGNPEHYAVVMGGVIAPPAGVDVTTLAGRGSFTLLLEVIRQGMADGELRDDLSAEDAAVFLWSTVHGYVLLAGDKQPFVPEVDLPAAQETVLDAALRGLSPDGPTEG
jgi:AcrR family transcriptional regulator